MAEHTISRRQFLRKTTKVGAAFALASALSAPAFPMQADYCGSILIPDGGLDILRMPDAQGYLGGGLGALWVAGSLLNQFAGNLDFTRLPPHLRYYFGHAGGEWKSSYEATRLWKTIPESIRMGGADEIALYLKNKEWSHIVPKRMGGATTADNGIFELSNLNRSRGGRVMAPEEFSAAKAVIKHDVTRSIVRQTVGGMIKGGLTGVAIGAVLLSLEYGLLYAEGKISWERMVRSILESALVAGIGGFLITGLIVGLALLFPVLLPIVTPVLFALSISSVVFLGPRAYKLAKGWWSVLDGQERLEDAIAILTSCKDVLSGIYSKVVGNRLSSLWIWIKGLGGAAWSWSASQTAWVRERAGEFVHALAKWDYLPDLPDLNVGSVSESIARVVAAEFCAAISATDALLDSIGGFRNASGLGTEGVIAVA